MPAWLRAWPAPYASPRPKGAPVPSVPAEATRLAVRGKDHARDVVDVPGKSARCRPVAPSNRRRVRRSGHGQRAVAPERQRTDHGTPVQGDKAFPARAQVVQLHGAEGPPGQRLAVRAEGEAIGLDLLAREHRLLPGGGHVPDGAPPGRGPPRPALAVRRKGQGADLVAMPVQRSPEPGRQVPQFDRVIPTARSQRLAVGAEGQGITGPPWISGATEGGVSQSLTVPSARPKPRYGRRGLKPAVGLCRCGHGGCPTAAHWPRPAP